MAEPARKNPYQAVSIQASIMDCCEAARGIEGQRFLLADAPMLPLDDCDRIGACQCKYQKWEDRRLDDRRMVDLGIGTQYYQGNEKRTIRRGRRSSD